MKTIKAALQNGYGTIGSAFTLDNKSSHPVNEPNDFEKDNEVGNLLPKKDSQNHLSFDDATDNAQMVVKDRVMVILGAIFAVAAGTLAWMVISSPDVKEHVTYPFHRPEDLNGRAKRSPLSALDPVRDLGVKPFDRPKMTKPSPILSAGRESGAYPTNAWYQNLLLPLDEPNNLHRAYPIPYIVDVVGPVAGLRVHPNHPSASSNVVQLVSLDEHGLTLGAAADATETKNGFFTRTYTVDHSTTLGLTLRWNYFPMTSSIVTGMPYATVIYEKLRSRNIDGEILLPTVASEIPLGRAPLADGQRNLTCAELGGAPERVEHEIELYFEESDFKWAVFVSHPTMVQCVASPTGGALLQVVELADKRASDPSSASPSNFTMRIALLASCTTGRNPIYCHQEQLHPSALFTGQGTWDSILRNHSHVYPGPNASFDYHVNEERGILEMIYNWDARNFTNTSSPWRDEYGLIVFALPHHLDIFPEYKSPDIDLYCDTSLLGPACVVESSRWELEESLPRLGFQASRSPGPWAIVDLCKALSVDLDFRLPKYFQAGAGDTYFSGKMLARLGRVILIADEVHELCWRARRNASDPYHHVCNDVKLPKEQAVNSAIDALRSSVEIWLNGSAKAPFVYDTAWGGLVSCGCHFNEKTQSCDNLYPDCPAFDDPGLNFGNAFYNDQHFHYGYHIYAAAVTSRFDVEWGRKFFERVLLLVRSIANPSADDTHFPLFRHKDWYRGHSFASGITRPAYLNGRNQESSSEAIAAYEAVALYGEVMSTCFREKGSESELRVAKEIYQIGLALVTSELRSARRYYHVDKSLARIFPTAYTPHVVGILWNTMFQFQTWFGIAPYLTEGIQLLPLTPIAESRDTIPWAQQMYRSYQQSCDADPNCVDSGWRILQYALLATVGHPREAFARILKLNLTVFEDPGGDGHSLTNTLWFAATRPTPDTPLPLQPMQNASKDDTSMEHIDCAKPSSCTGYVLDTVADSYTCRQRITWLMREHAINVTEACAQVATEYFNECGDCNPYGNATNGAENRFAQCPPCSDDQCRSSLNRCPEYTRTFVCAKGSNEGGCSGSPWPVGFLCDECCELTDCPKVSAADQLEHEYAGYIANCPPCPKDVCKSDINLCPVHSAPFLCTHGISTAGCSRVPWSLSGGQCESCCKVTEDCR